MSYDTNVYIGLYAKCKLKPGCSSVGIHWLLDDKDEKTVRDKTKGRAGVEDLHILREAHFVFPEFLTDKHKYAYIMAPGYTKLDDVRRMDSDVFPIGESGRNVYDNTAFVDQLIHVFDFESVQLFNGAIVEVV